MNRKVIAHANLGIFVSEVIAAVKLGWELDPAFNVALYGYYYEAQLLRDPSITDEPKMTAAESLAKARAAKKAKADETADQPEGA